MAVSKQNKLAIITAILLLIGIHPYYVWGILKFKLFSPLLTILIGLIFISKIKKLTRKDSKLIILYVLTAALYVFLTILHGSSNTNGIITRALVFLLLFVPLGEDSFLKNVFQSFITGYTVIITLSLISWIFILNGSMPSFGTIESPFDSRLYIQYPFVVVENAIKNLARFAGPFDEPGVVGTFSGIILIIQNFKFRDWKTIIVLISGLLSLSLFFYVIVIIYGLVYFLIIRKKYIYVILFIGLFSCFYYATKDNELLNLTLWQRLEWDKDTNKFKGDNRINELGDDYYNSIIGTKEYYWGLNDTTSFWSYAEGSSTYKATIITNGIIFFYLYIFFFIFMANSYRKDYTSLALFIFLLLLNTYQRPDIYGVTLIFLYTYLARNNIDLNLVKTNSIQRYVN